MVKKLNSPPKRPCPSGFYRNAKGQCVQKGVGPAYKGG